MQICIGIQTLARSLVRKISKKRDFLIPNFHPFEWIFWDYVHGIFWAKKGRFLAKKRAFFFILMFFLRDLDVADGRVLMTQFQSTFCMSASLSVVLYIIGNHGDAIFLTQSQTQVYQQRCTELYYTLCVKSVHVKPNYVLFHRLIANTLVF